MQVRRFFKPSEKSLKCPCCSTPMGLVQIGRGFYYICQADGIWLYVSFFASLKNSRSIVDRIFSARSQICETQFVRNCPSCRRELIATRFSAAPEIIIDQCTHCNGVWFDRGELNEIDGKGEVEEEFPSSNKKPFRSHELPTDVANAQNFWPSQTESPEESFHPLHLLSLPVLESSKTPAPPVSVVVSFLAAGSVVFTARALKSESFLEQMAFFPSDPFRRDGVTFLTSSLVHGGWWHLLSNFYFFFVCGNRLEEALGPGFVLLLFSISAVGGDLAYALSGSQIPTIGASGGIAGLLAYFAMKYPKNKFSFGWWYRSFTFATVSLTAIETLICFFVIQAVGVVFSNGSAGTNFIAHAGGALIGLLAYVFYPGDKSVRPNQERT